MRPLALTDLVGIYLPAAVLLSLIWGKFKNFNTFFLFYIRVVHTFFGN